MVKDEYEGGMCKDPGAKAAAVYSIPINWCYRYSSDHDSFVGLKECPKDVPKV